MKHSWILLGLILVLGEVVMAIEEPSFEVQESFGDIEIRKYQPMVVAETEVAANFEEAGNQGFRRVAGYIFGGNQTKEKISMTAPVFQEGSDSKIKIAFVMPQGKNLTNLPIPTDSQVVFREFPARKMAVIKYSGTWSEERYREKLQQLLDQLKSHHLSPKGSPLWARYNPPWMPWFLRRNEVLIEIN